MIFKKKKRGSKKKVLSLTIVSIASVLCLTSCADIDSDDDSPRSSRSSRSSDSSYSSDSSKKGKRSGASTKEMAVQNYYNNFSSGDPHKILCSIAPQEVWDYCTNKYRLSEDELLYEILKIESDEEYNELIYSAKLYFKDLGLDNLEDLAIYDSWLEEFDYKRYDNFNMILHKAGIKSDADPIYYLSPPNGIDVDYEDMTPEEKRAEDERLNTPGINLFHSLIYKLDGNWYCMDYYLIGNAFGIIEDYEEYMEDDWH